MSRVPPRASDSQCRSDAGAATRVRGSEEMAISVIPGPFQFGKSAPHVRNPCGFIRHLALYAMARIYIEVEIASHAEPIFDRLQNHADYQRFRSIDASRLLEEGRENKNGVGALRELRAGPIVFREEITHYEPPLRLDYLIRECNAPIRHEYGSIRLTSVGPHRTLVTWESRFELDVPLLGAVFAPFAAWTGERAFRGILEEIKAELQEIRTPV